MFRRFVSIFVLVGFIAGQWAAIPHAHGAVEIPGHNAVPHIHLSLLCRHPAHEHSHAGHGHGHSHRTHHQQSPASNNSLGEGDDHDADAIYLPTVTPSIGSSNRGGGGSFKWQIAPALLPNPAVSGIGAAALRQINIWQHPPELCAPNCALYLKLRALRI